MEGIDTQSEEIPEEHHRTIDTAELYDGLALQTGYENLHSQYWYDQQAQVENSFAKGDGKFEFTEEVPVSHAQTIDTAELYNGMAVQLSDHSATYNNLIAEQSKQFEAAEAYKESEMTPEEKMAIKKANAPLWMTEKNKVAVTDLVPHHKNMDIDTSIYNGIHLTANDYVQLGDHTNDNDDVVPEFSEEVKEHSEQALPEEKHFAFDGAEIKETYDE
jgi:hypothetical protein